jgi:glycosyltransferase involved in cell wall biosynthesis
VAGGKPKLLVVITLAEVGGAQSCVAQLLPGLTGEFDVVVAAHGEGPLRAAALEAGARWEPLRHVRRALGPRDALGLVELVRLIRRERPAIVHAHSSKAGVLARVAAALCRTPCRVFTAHGWAFKADTGLRAKAYLLADRLVAPLTSAVVCPSRTERTAGLGARTCRAERTVVIPYGIDAGGYSVRGHEQRKPRVVSIGRLRAPKDFETLLRALALLADLDFEALIVGDGPDGERLAPLVGELGLGGTVQLCGERHDVPELLASSDCFVLSSLSECLPMSILEAMAAGLPVVASDVGGVAEEVEDGTTGLLAPARDAERLAAALRPVLTDAALRARMGAAGRQRCLEDFSLERYRAAHVELYRGLLAAAAPAPQPCEPAAASA